MHRFEFVSHDGCCSSGILRFKDNGKPVSTERSIIKYSCGPISEKRWDVDDIFWVFIPGKMFDDEEKKLFLEMLNPHYTEIRAKCKSCIGYAELNGVPLEGEPPEQGSTDRLTKDEIDSLRIF
ncbi:hypothetical protein R80B4_01094 [Fibrobacteres bacterium R8-0-B4]